MTHVLWILLTVAICATPIFVRAWYWFRRRRQRAEDIALRRRIYEHSWQLPHIATPAYYQEIVAFELKLDPKDVKVLSPTPGTVIVRVPRYVQKSYLGCAQRSLIEHAPLGICAIIEATL